MLSSSIKLPQARTESLIVKSLTQETLAYDLQMHRAYCLNEVASRIWKLCNGHTTLEQAQIELQSKIGKPVSTDLILCGLLELQKAGLLENSNQNTQAILAIEGASTLTSPSLNKQPRIHRRELMKRLAISSALIPVVASVLAPTTVMAASCRAKGQPCGAGLPACCSGLTCTNPTGIGQCATT